MSDSLSLLHIHFIFSTKSREPTITPDIRPRLHAYIAVILKELNCRDISVGGVEDHVHILADIHRSMSVAEIMRVVKANSSKWLSTTFSAAGEFEWQRGYAAFAVSRSGVDSVRRYVQNQPAQHASLSSRDELIMFFRKHEVEFDERYVE